MFGPEPIRNECVFTAFRESCLHATYPVASKDLSLGHFVGHQSFVKRNEIFAGKRQIIEIRNKNGQRQDR